MPLAGTELLVVTEIIVVALLERAQRQYGLCPLQAPPLAFTLHPVLDDGTARRLHDACPHGQACRQVRIVPHPAPVVREERDDLFERLPHRLPQPPLREPLAQSADAIAHSAAQKLRQLLLHPAVPALVPSPNKA
jgi:hypothetical protein